MLFCFSWNPNEALPHLTTCFRLQAAALPCGLQGFAALHAFLQQHITKTKQDISVTLNCVHAPTYYGMMAASFLCN